MSAIELICELLPVILASAGLSGGVFTGLLRLALNKAKRDADKKREERLKLELLRLEGEERQSKLFFALLRHLRTGDGEQELAEAEHAYTQYIEKSLKLKNEIISEYTSR
ncbi:MAG: hypothetical protein IJY88_04400 [Clostridia bacterium]|nr:hypothetical protein [Clostridia bacterium]